MKTQEQMIEWYISAVKASLIRNFAVSEEEASIAVKNYGLRGRILKNPQEELMNSIDGMAETIARFEFVGRPCQLTYKGFFTNVRYDTQLKSLYGRVYGIEEFVSFEAADFESCESSFHKAVDDYLEYGKIAAEPDPFDAESLPDLGIPKFEPAQKSGNISNEDFLRSFGIDPEEKTDYPEGGDAAMAGFGGNEAAHGFEEIDLRMTPEMMASQSDSDFLRSFGIDPDDVIF